MGSMLKEKTAQSNSSEDAKSIVIMLRLVIGVLFLLGGGMLYAISEKPELGARIADILRRTIGNEPVAYLETTMFAVQDNVRQLEYQVAGKKAASPWSLTPIPTQVIEMTPTLPAATPNPSQPLPTSTPKPNMNLIGVSWPPPNITNRMGVLDDEGIWTPYLYDSHGRVVAYRTFLQPDRQRPYAMTAIVVFNLNVTRLGFMIGTHEPYSTAKLQRSGVIPAQDRQPGVLLATFNGGFQAQHGQFGAMYEGNVVLPGREGMGTLLLYKDGRLRIAPWDAKFNDMTEIQSWRQNGPMLVQNNEINPDTSTSDKNKSIEFWGATVDGNTVTWRSGIGLSANKKFLYYVAGPGLTVPTLANALKTIGAVDAMQLDINPYWVHFVSVRHLKDQLKADPLLPEMHDNPDRYFYNYSRDYFYVTAHNTEQ